MIQDETGIVEFELSLFGFSSHVSTLPSYLPLLVINIYPILEARPNAATCPTGASNKVLSRVVLTVYAKAFYNERIRSTVELRPIQIKEDSAGCLAVMWIFNLPDFQAFHDLHAFNSLKRIWLLL